MDAEVSRINRPAQIVLYQQRPREIKLGFPMCSPRGAGQTVAEFSSRCRFILDESLKLATLNRILPASWMLNH